MKNITLSIEAGILSTVRKYAAAHNSSVNALVRDYLTALAKRHDSARAARRRIAELSELSQARVGPRTWNRDDLHER